MPIILCKKRKNLLDKIILHAKSRNLITALWVVRQRKAYDIRANLKFMVRYAQKDLLDDK
ncbi:hypothetical protein HYD_4310 [Candidatus Hydrogenosomobacter endosymbioticus]|uniref:Uncharacterized protein n=1 Tax=Candidatus Hydrogenosomobacter endosymbioticus TaxID=2558174 RepID=A0ABM7V923_9PROT|nr:hypothetical protein HYD_4310 [Candidatus Hydrogenosomobacter endosymbioticus]